MPLFFQHSINATTKLGIWKIEEPESFFLQHVPLQRSITHPHKRLQHLAGRYLLKYFFSDFPHHEILIADTRKPYLPYEQYHFSISHCGSFAAAIVSSTNRVGIDIEIPCEKVERIKHKFLGVDEAFLVSRFSLPEAGSQITVKQTSNPKPQILNNHQLSTLVWSAKESLFKWYSLGEVSFKQHIQLRQNIIEAEDGWMELPFVFKKQEEIFITVFSKLFEEIVLSYCFS